MSSRFARVLGIGFVTLSASALVLSCASSDNGTTFPSGGSGNADSGVDSSFGGNSGGGTGGSVSTGGTGNVGGNSMGGTGNAGGFGGTSTGGTAGSGTGGSGGGSCNPAFCPSSGFGQACCVTSNGPCGTDTGTGCQQTSTSNDF